MAVDVGTGDGRYVCDMARRQSDWLWVGIDAARDQVAENAARAAAPPAKGGLPNALFVAAAAEALPPELSGAADLVTVQFPWGSLLRAVLLPDVPVLAGLSRLARPGAAFVVVINTTVFRPPVPREVVGLPVLDAGFLCEVLAPAYARAGIALAGWETLGRTRMATWPTTWARRLAAGPAPEALLLHGVVGNVTDCATQPEGGDDGRASIVSCGIG